MITIEMVKQAHKWLTAFLSANPTPSKAGIDPDRMVVRPDKYKVELPTEVGLAIHWLYYSIRMCAPTYILNGMWNLNRVNDLGIHPPACCEYDPSTLPLGLRNVEELYTHWQEDMRSLLDHVKQFILDPSKKIMQA